MSNHITIGTRGSKLALWQAHFVKSELQKIGYEVHIQVISTRGDQLQHLSFDKIEGKGFFTQELEDSLISEKIDLAVHSMKDLPTEMDPRLVIGGLSQREDPADWLLISPSSFDETKTLKLKEGSRVGTSSNRRKAQLLHLRRDLHLVDLRGNVPTRVNKLREGKADAIVLAAAGLTRLDLDLGDLHVIRLNPREFVPAPAQGILAYQVKKDRVEMRNLVQQIHHREVAILSNVERKILKLLEGGCHLPLGAYCVKDQMNYFHVWTAYAPSLDHELKFYNISLSTVDGLAESVVEQLTKS